MTRRSLLAAGLLLVLSGAARADFSSLNLGLDYRLRGVSVDNNDTSDKTKDHLGYYSQSAKLYMTAWLNEDVEASFRLHSISLWGLEGGTKPATIYPRADGTPWVEEAYVHLPNIFNKRLDLTIGRQPVTLGDGMLVGSDQGFNALRAVVRGPWKTEMDVFTAKIAESLNGHKDTDLSGATFRTRQEDRHWDIGVVQEFHGFDDGYRLGFSTYTATRVLRRFYDVRLFGDLKDAYYKIEVAVQQGDANLVGPGRVKIKGMGQRLELGAQKDTDKWGRFGVKAVYALGSGDDNGTPGTDEAFRPSFAHRWDGLQRAGYGSHVAATLSDVYDPSNPFAPGSNGLPPGVSGVKTTGLGLFSTQKVFWTGSVDYYIYESRTKPTGLSDLGAEIDGQITYRYSGFVTFTGGTALYFPGNLYANSSRVMRLFFETHVHF